MNLYLSRFRIYEPHECSEKDGYPFAWHDFGDGIGIKHVVRAEAGSRCIRCGHPYVVGESGTYEIGGEAREVQPVVLERFAEFADAAAIEKEVKQKGIHWSPCDEFCTHGGPARARVTSTRPWEVKDDATAGRLALALSQGNEVQAAWRILTVHHLNERKHDCRWHNLCALCQRCHLTIQRKVTMEQVWPFEHSDWFKPYAAAFYAYSYLGEELTREQTMERLDELLALERVA